MSAPELNPYSTPHAGVGESRQGATRNPWIAVLLSFLSPPIGMLYLARPVRAAVYLAGLLLIAAAGVAGVGDHATTLSVFLSIAAAIDGYRLARRWSRASLPWYSRAGALAAIFGVGVCILLGSRVLLAEPFRIASGAMEPTLHSGEHILVNKASYGWSNPINGSRVVSLARPKRGDVAAFRYPVNRNLTYIKRIVAGPGDTVAYEDKRLTVNAEKVPRTLQGTYELKLPTGVVQEYQRHEERLGDATYSILIDPNQPALAIAGVGQFEGREHCKFAEGGFTCSVPAGHYFVMGDNRDASDDSRYWGFVREDDFIGRAF